MDPILSQNKNNLFHEFEKQVLKQSDGPALTDSYGTISYQELLDLVLEKIQFLKTLKLPSKARIGMAMPADRQSVAVVLAVFSLQYVVVFLDSAAPIDWLLQKSQDLLISYIFTKINNELELSFNSDADIFASSEFQDDAYLFMTSGSTNKPKAAIFTHQAAVAFINWVSNEFHLSSSDVFLFTSAFHFDLTVFELLLPLSIGAHSVIAGPGAKILAGSLFDIIETHKVSVIETLPRVWGIIHEQSKNSITKDYPTVKNIFLTGEAFRLDHLDFLRKLFSKSKIYNLYGQTETNSYLYFQLNNYNQMRAETPIGFQNSLNKVQIRDDHNQIVPPNQLGQLWVNGPTLMRGYWDNDSKSVLKRSNNFFPTGDLVWIDQSGLLYLKSRKTTYIKFRGQRISLAEIEFSLKQIHLISEAVVFHNEGDDNKDFLVAVVESRSMESDLIKQIKYELSKKLPSILIPSQFFIEKSLPKSSTGKVDRNEMIKKYKV